MEENRKELNPEEMLDVSGGNDAGYQREYRCPDCSFTSTNRNEFFTHLRTHTEVRPRPSSLPIHP